MKRETNPSMEDVLEAFACEPDKGRTTIEQYLRCYPEYAEAIVDFSAKIAWEVKRYEALSDRELDMIHSGWLKHIDAAPNVIADPFVALSHVELVRVTQFLKIPRQVLTAFRDRSVVVTSIPKRFLSLLAEEIHCDVAALMAHLSGSPTLSLDRSRKSNVKPETRERKTFEKILTDAGVPLEDQKSLMEEDSD